MVSRSVVLILLVCCLPFLVGFGPPKLVESDNDYLPIGSSQLRAIDAGRPPALAGRAALVMDLGSNRVVYQRNGDRQAAPASLAKIMTAVLAIEGGGDLTATVGVQADDLIEGSAMGLKVGDQVTLEQLLWGLLLPSGNDAAEAIARYVGGGSVSRFVAMMNKKAQVLGLANTHFANPHGLDAAGHYTSALDIAELSRYALRSPIFAKIVAARQHELTVSGRSFTVRNTNTLLFETAPAVGVTGVKTGFTDNAGDSLVASFERDGRKMLVVVLGANNRNEAALALVAYAFEHFVAVPAPLPLASVAPRALPGGGAPMLMLPVWQRPLLRFTAEVSTVTGQPPAGPNGLLTYLVGSQEIGRLALFVPSTKSPQ